MALTVDGRMPVDVADGLLFAVVQVCKGLVLLQVGVGLAAVAAVVLLQGLPVVDEHVHDLVLLEGCLEPAEGGEGRSGGLRRRPPAFARSRLFRFASGAKRKTDDSTR